MKKIYQTDYSPETGNCFQACVASALEVPLSNVPHFCSVFKPDQWFWHFREWVKRNYGFSVICHLIEGGLDYDFECYEGIYLVSGKSPRGDHLHCVVYKDGKMTHDPHPSNSGIENIHDIITFCPLDISNFNIVMKGVDSNA